jgi:hypothetical protein
VRLPAVLGVTVWLPLEPCVPVHAPLALHEVAFVDDHCRVAFAPATTDVGLTEIVTVGAGVGVGVGAGDEEPPPQARLIKRDAINQICEYARVLLTSSLSPSERT